MIEVLSQEMGRRCSISCQQWADHGKLEWSPVMISGDHGIPLRDTTMNNKHSGDLCANSSVNEKRGIIDIINNPD